MGKEIEYRDSIDTNVEYIDMTDERDKQTFEIIKTIMLLPENEFEDDRMKCLNWCDGNEEVENIVNLFFDVIGKERGIIK